MYNGLGVYYSSFDIGCIIVHLPQKHGRYVVWYPMEQCS